jgi:hypothetical protein
MDKNNFQYMFGTTLIEMIDGVLWINNIEYEEDSNIVECAMAKRIAADAGMIPDDDSIEAVIWYR